MGEDEDLFDANMKEEEDVYDVVDEDEYQSLVNSRRQREDFVVDDGKLKHRSERNLRISTMPQLPTLLLTCYQQTDWDTTTMEKSDWETKMEDHRIERSAPVRRI